MGPFLHLQSPPRPLPQSPLYLPILRWPFPSLQSCVGPGPLSNISSGSLGVLFRLPEKWQKGEQSIVTLRLKVSGLLLVNWNSQKTKRCWLDENPSSISIATITESLNILESFGTSCNLSYEFAIDNKPITIKGLGAKDKQMESGKQFRCFPCRCRQVNQICSFLKQRKDRALHHSVCTLVCCYDD